MLVASLGAGNPCSPPMSGGGHYHGDVIAMMCSGRRVMCWVLGAGTSITLTGRRRTGTASGLASCAGAAPSGGRMDGTGAQHEKRGNRCVCRITAWPSSLA